VESATGRFDGASVSPAAPATAPAPAAPVAAPPIAAPVLPPAAAAAAAFDEPATPASPASAVPHDNGGERPSKLPDLARQAALAAEREAIQAALDRFRWNRRKAAQLLGVSYKTLLNKMKECGISAPAE
jgi:DNA-binding NtrC family response regulator